MYKETTQDLCQACETNKARISSYAIINMRLCPECYKNILEAMNEEEFEQNKQIEVE